MKNGKNTFAMLVILVAALVPMILLAGCHGNLGWDRMGGTGVTQAQSDHYGSE